MAGTTMPARDPVAKQVGMAEPAVLEADTTPRTHRWMNPTACIPPMRPKMCGDSIRAMNLTTTVADFVQSLSAIIEKDATDRARTAILAAFGSSPRRGPGRPPRLAQTVDGLKTVKKARKKAPLQLCPVPNCKNRAAPVFGMVCATHKDLPKARIRAFREARRAKKLGVKPGKPVKELVRKARRMRARSNRSNRPATPPTTAAVS